MPAYFVKPCSEDPSELKEPEVARFTYGDKEEGSDDFVTPFGWRESWFGSFPDPEVSEEEHEELAGFPPFPHGLRKSQTLWIPVWHFGRREPILAMVEVGRT